MTEPTSASRLALRNYPTNSIPLMEQKWHDLLFLHWEYDPDLIQQTLPKGLHVDLFNGKAYIGLIPFFMKDVRVKMMPALPGMSDFLELNLRTYVYDETGTPGVWFYSLDINSMLAVQIANSFFHLPYMYATMESHLTAQDEIAFRCQRQGIDYSLEVIYKSKGSPWSAESHTLEFFLIERYALFTHKGDNQISIGRVHHSPYSLFGVDVPKWDDATFEWDGLKRPARPPDHICFSPGVNVEIFSLNDVENGH